MIRSEAEYLATVKSLTEQSARLKDEEARYKKMGYSKDEITRLLDPETCFRDGIAEEVASYERLKRGEFDEIYNFRGIGRLLIALRIVQGLSQRESAERLGVHESQVSRDERNDYHGITLDRAERILDALGVSLRTVVAEMATTAGTK